MTTLDPATLTGLLEVCRANGLPTHGWEQERMGDMFGIQNMGYYWHKEGVGLTEKVTPADLAAVCFEVAKWLRDEHGRFVLRHGSGCWLSCGTWKGALDKKHKRILHCTDTEPAALLAACKEVMK